MRFILPLLAMALPLPAAGQTMSGPATAIDGDTLDMAGTRIRLFGIDAPEVRQTCDRKGASWACGSDAKALLAETIAGRTIECTPRDRDAYGRVVAACRAGASDLGGVMVREGLAIAFTRYSLDYVEAEARAKAFKLALWGSVFQTPAEYRAANSTHFKSPAPRPAVRTASTRVASFSSAAYRSCAAARAAGATPLYRGRPGYGAHMDGDGDGVACERG